MNRDQILGPLKGSFKKVHFNLEVLLQSNCDQVKLPFDSFVADLTTVFDRITIKSCCITHSSGKQYKLAGQGKGNKFKKIIPVFGDCVAPIIWKGYVELNEHNLRKHWINLVRQLCLSRSYRPSYCANWRFEEDFNFVKLIEVESDIQLDETSFPSTIYSFSLGNIINGNRFIIHFGPLRDKPPIITYNDDRNTKICIENIKIKHDHIKKKFGLKFNLKTTTGDTIAVIESKYRLIYDYKSIKSALICLRRKHLDLYIQFSYPPRIFVQQPDQKNNTLKRSRITDCGDKLSSDVIGYSNVLRLVFDMKDDSILSTIYRWKNYHNFDISYGSLDEFHMKPNKLVYSKSFPMSVNYALNCIYSIGYNFSDDLRKNDEEKIINEIISKYINSYKEELIVEALYRLFYAYLAGKVYNAIEHLKLFLKRIGSEKMKTTNKHESNYQSLAIITPTRTIFTPLIAHHPGYMTDHLIKIIIRDENIDLANLLGRNIYDNLDDKIPYRKRSKANDRFLIRVVGAKFLELKCLNVAGTSYHLPKLDRISPLRFKNGHRILIKSEKPASYHRWAWIPVQY